MKIEKKNNKLVVTPRNGKQLKIEEIDGKLIISEYIIED